MPQNLYCQVKEILNKARSNVYKTINFTMVEAYWNIGRLIFKKEQHGKIRADYGHKLLEGLAKKLTTEFGRGFDASNLWNMRKFYITFPILDSLRRELRWTHYRLLIRVENTRAREFYINECADSNWSTRQLERQIVSPNGF